MPLSVCDYFFPHVMPRLFRCYEKHFCMPLRAWKVLSQVNVLC